ncbi:MAG TPA: DUF6644 family protein [Bryobacteraceae bacterium]|nr:DUF6644 family protein [Bryobacteraceae bacterium]
MSFHDIFQAVQDTEFFTAMRESALVYPIVLSLHLTCIAIFGGMILMTDLRLLGWAFQSVPVSDVVKQFRPFKTVGLIVMVSCGILLGGAKIVDYYDNPYFLIKMTLLLLVAVHAWVFHRDVYGNTQVIDRAPAIPAKAKAAAYLSLFLWLGIMSMGRWIAYYERPEPHPLPRSHALPVIPELHRQDYARAQR